MKHNGPRRRHGWTWGIAAGLATVCLAGEIALLADAQSADAAVTAPTINSSGQYGNAVRYAPYFRQQTTGDCVERSALLGMSAIAGKWVASTSGIDAEAVKLGILASNNDGSSWDAYNVALFAHYGFTASKPHATSRGTVEADLFAGDAVEVTVYGGDLWDGIPVPGQPGMVYGDPNTTPSPDHAVVVEAINRTTGAVTLGDSGVPFGAAETVPWSQFSKAWSVGGYSAMIISK